MSNTKHTPEPWTAADERAGPHSKARVVTVYANEEPVGNRLVAFHVAGKDHAQALANGRLIAVAPDLLAALRDLRTAATEAYKAGRIEAEPFVRAGNVIARAETR